LHWDTACMGLSPRISQVKDLVQIFSPGAENRGKSGTGANLALTTIASSLAGKSGTGANFARAKSAPVPDFPLVPDC
jgi:hypothetical protein